MGSIGQPLLFWSCAREQLNQIAEHRHHATLHNKAISQQEGRILINAAPHRGELGQGWPVVSSRGAAQLIRHAPNVWKLLWLPLRLLTSSDHSAMKRSLIWPKGKGGE